MKIGELSRISGVATSAIRFYEEQGLLSAARAGNGYREYESNAMERLHLIQVSKKLGFSLESIRIMFMAHDQCSREATLEQVDIRLREVEALQAEMAIQHRNLTMLREIAARGDMRETCRAKMAMI